MVEFHVKYEEDFNVFKCRYKKDSVPRLMHLPRTSLLCSLTQDSKVRYRAVQISFHAAFNNLILLCILLNTVCMALFDQA